MKTSIENEAKIIIDKEQYDKLFKSFTWVDCYHQLNFYYANNDMINNNEPSTIRIRSINNKLLLQVKCSLDDSNGLIHSNIEYEKEIKKVPFSLSGTELNSMCGKNTFNDVELLNCLFTERYLCIWDDNTDIFLDKNTYLNTVDYELEIEYISKDLDVKLLSLIQDIGINTNKRAIGKYKRFLELYNMN